MLTRCLRLIEESAKIPSFSSFEERIHPFVRGIVAQFPDCTLDVIEDRNLLIRVPGNKPGRVAFTAHLDKINHFGKDEPDELPFERSETKLTGQMDNTAGLGIVLTLLEEANRHKWPELLIMLSEMEESTGLKKHPELLRNNGEGLYHGMGAERLAKHLISKNIIPDSIITVDTTPLFKGDKGVALYSGHWQFTKTQPSEEEITKTRALVDTFTQVDPNLHLANNTNDYLTYGKILNENTGFTVPSVALEPAIFPYHTRNESVYIEDIERILGILNQFLSRNNGIREIP